MTEKRQRRFLWLFLTIGLSSMSFTGCATDEVKETETIPEKTLAESAIPPKKPLETASSQHRGNSATPATPVVNRLATLLYNQLKSQEGNLFLSPYSVTSTLTMIYAGVSGDTENQMTELFQADNKLNSDFGQLERSLASSGKYRLNLANQIWVQPNMPIKAEFSESLHETRQTVFKTADFQTKPEESRQQINNWVKEKTEGKIIDLITSSMITPQTQLAIVNAIYFKGKWQMPFDSEQTKEKPFSKLDGTEILVPMMMQDKAEFNYFEDDYVEWIELPYSTDGSENQISMQIVLPKKLENFSLVEEKLENYINSKGETEELSVYLPKFTLKSSFQLETYLQKLGMTDAFDPAKADFSKMTDAKGIAISTIAHQAFVEVNEEGTEAAAATAAIVSRGRSKVFRVNRPFIFLIKEVQSGTILFLGRVTNPL